MTERDLSVALAARETGTALSDTTEEDYRPILVDLRHRCLPKLEGVGWIERHPAGAIAAESLPVGDEDSLLPDLQDSDLAWKAIGTLLAHPRRQELVSIVADQHHLTVEELATELGEHGHPSKATKPLSYAVLLRTLHHADLPKLAEVGLIEYDHDEKTVTRTRSLKTLGNRIDLDTRLTEAIDPE
jgi:hypothetical protein